ncbi:MAG: carbohydrate-binding family 9-like protein [Candidatus Latescibacteria bacterium]|jgi:hypothetical protein|nr:carbohydrate-binding family 9-like protein [Candidatus Latescibacterota bacterium]
MTDEKAGGPQRRIVNFPMRGQPGRHLVCPSGQAPYDHLPPVVRYTCRRVTDAMKIDGGLTEKAWENAEWSSPFVEISDGGVASVATRLALLWDADFLYAGYRVEDHDIRGSMGAFHDHVYMEDDDVELFVEGDGYYYEIGINPLNNVYELRWTWLEPLVREQRYEELEVLLRREDYLYYVARDGDKLGRIGDLNYRLPGLQTAVHLDGVLNQPEINDRGWTVEFALPWDGLRSVSGGAPMPPRAGDTLRMMGYRMHHFRADEKSGQHEASTWNVVGGGNIHNPDRWSTVVFSDEVV